MAAIGPPHTPVGAAKGFRSDLERAERVELTRDEGGPRGEGGGKICSYFHADPAWIQPEGLGNGPVIGYGCVVVMGQQAC